MNAQDTPAFLREQITLCAQAYLQVRPGSRASAEILHDQQSFRDRLANALRVERQGRRASIDRASTEGAK